MSQNVVPGERIQWQTAAQAGMPGAEQAATGQAAGTKPDESANQKYTEAEAVTAVPDDAVKLTGDTTISTDGVAVAPDGTVIETSETGTIISTADGVEITVDAEGNLLIDSDFRNSPDISDTSTLALGASYKTESGTAVTRNDDGSITIEQANGQILTVNPDGSVEVDTPSEYDAMTSGEGLLAGASEGGDTGEAEQESGAAEASEDAGSGGGVASGGGSDGGGADGSMPSSGGGGLGGGGLGGGSSPQGDSAASVGWPSDQSSTAGLGGGLGGGLSGGLGGGLSGGLGGGVGGTLASGLGSPGSYSGGSGYGVSGDFGGGYSPPTSSYRPSTNPAGDFGYRPIDADGDGIPDYRDLDSNNDGIPDSLSYSPPSYPGGGVSPMSGADTPGYSPSGYSGGGIGGVSSVPGVDMPGYSRSGYSGGGVGGVSSVPGVDMPGYSPSGYSGGGIGGVSSVPGVDMPTYRPPAPPGGGDGPMPDGSGTISGVVGSGSAVGEGSGTISGVAGSGRTDGGVGSVPGGGGVGTLPGGGGVGTLPGGGGGGTVPGGGGGGVETVPGGGGVGTVPGGGGTGSFTVDLSDLRDDAAHYRDLAPDARTLEDCFESIAKLVQNWGFWSWGEKPYVAGCMKFRDLYCQAATEQEETAAGLLEVADEYQQQEESGVNISIQINQ